MYAAQFYDAANTVLENFVKAQKAMGINVSQSPDFIEVPDELMRKYGRDGGRAYAEEINRAINNKTKIAVVLIRYENHYEKVKKALDQKGIPSQFLRLDTVHKPITVYSNLLKQMNAKLKQDLYHINIEKDFANSMVIGVDVCHAGRNSIVGLTATYTPHLTQHFCRAY